MISQWLSTGKQRIPQLIHNLLISWLGLVFKTKMLSNFPENVIK